MSHCSTKISSPITSIDYTVVLYITYFALPNSLTNGFNSSGLGTLAQAILVCSLPLSAIWASFEVKSHGLVHQSTSTTIPNSSVGSHPQSKCGIFYCDKLSKDLNSDVEKALSYSTDGTQLHPPADHVSDQEIF